YWKAYLGGEWTEAQEVPRLEDQFERFDEGASWSSSPLVLHLPPNISQFITQSRVQIIRGDQERMLQLQDSRFILNWRKQDRAYPSYGILSDEFWRLYRSFEVFAGESAGGSVQP